MLEDPHGLSGGIDCLEPRSCVVKEIKVAVFGKSGVGKTATIAKICGKDFPGNHSKTVGLNISSLYWHAQPSLPGSNPLFLHVHFWDCGEDSLHCYDYLKPAMLKDASVCMFCFSMNDRSTWEGLSDLIDEVSGGCAKDQNPVYIAVGTRLDVPFRDVSKSELVKFQASTNIPVFAIGNSGAMDIKGFVDKFVGVLQENKLL